MKDWRDITSYSQGDKERIPNVFEIRNGMLRIVITNGHIYHKNEWIMHCPCLNIDTCQLEAKTFEDAKTEAIDTVVIEASNILKLVKDLKEKL